MYIYSVEVLVDGWNENILSIAAANDEDAKSKAVNHMVDSGFIETECMEVELLGRCPFQNDKQGELF